MRVSMQFVIVSTWMFLTNRARQPSDSLREQDIFKKWCQGRGKKKQKQVEKVPSTFLSCYVRNINKIKLCIICMAVRR